MPLQHINPQGVSTPAGYTHVVAAQGGRTVYISGQVATNAQGEVVGQGDLAAQTEQVFQNLKACLASMGASFANVTKLTTFVVNYSADQRPVIVEARARHLPADWPPASTLVGVQALANPAFLIEIEATAVID